MVIIIPQPITLYIHYILCESALHTKPPASLPQAQKIKKIDKFHLANEEMIAPYPAVLMCRTHRQVSTSCI